MFGAFELECAKVHAQFLDQIGLEPKLGSCIQRQSSGSISQMKGILDPRGCQRETWMYLNVRLIICKLTANEFQISTTLCGRRPRSAEVECASQLLIITDITSDLNHSLLQCIHCTTNRTPVLINIKQRCCLHTSLLPSRSSHRRLISAPTSWITAGRTVAVSRRPPGSLLPQDLGQDVLKNVEVRGIVGEKARRRCCVSSLLIWIISHSTCTASAGFDHSRVVSSAFPCLAFTAPASAISLRNVNILAP